LQVIDAFSGNLDRLGGGWLGQHGLGGVGLSGERRWNACDKYGQKGEEGRAEHRPAATAHLNP
ncbi:MAG: hypothetical protein AABZ22_05330, partial [Nitrospirota bacterium]